MGRTRPRVRSGLTLLSCVALYGCALLCGCAGASPLLAGGRTTPKDRVELAVGGAARLTYGELEGEATSVTTPGLTPVGRFSYGLSETSDLTLQISGALGQVSYHRTWWEDRTASLRPSFRVGVALEGGVTEDGGVIGGDLPLLLGFDATSVIEIWLGPRLGASRIFDITEDEIGARQHQLQVRIGGVLGVAAGFRHLHVLMELTAQYEIWLEAGTETVRNGLVLTPAFALRYRI